MLTKVGFPIKRMQKKNLCISLTNFNSENTIQCLSRIIVVKGIVEVKEKQEAFTQKDLEPKCLLEIKQNKDKLIPHRIAENNSFVFIAELSPGENVIEFIHKEVVVKQVVFNYTPVASMTTKVLPLLVLCADTRIEEKALQENIQKLELALLLVKTFFEEKLLEHGMERKSFELHPTPEILRLSITTREVKEMSVEKCWEHLAVEIKRNSLIWNPWHKFAAFMVDNCLKTGESVGDEHPDKLGCGGGGLSLLAFNSFPVWPMSTNEVLSNAFCESLLSDSDLIDIGYRLGCKPRSKGSLYCVTMGALAHELGHIFDLGHSESGLMGKDFGHFQEFFIPQRELKIKCHDCQQSIVGLELSKRLHNYSKNTITLSHSSANILYCHRWFNLTKEPHCDEKIFISIKQKKLVSKHPLCAVEIRHSENGLVYKQFEIKEDTHELPLFKQHISLTCGDDAQLVAQDVAGNLLKTPIYRSNLNNSFTFIKHKR